MNDAISPNNIAIENLTMAINLKIKLSICFKELTNLLA